MWVWVFGRKAAGSDSYLHTALAAAATPVRSKTFNPSDAALLDGERDWSTVLVIGEHKQNPNKDRFVKKKPVQLAGYTREVFGSQLEQRLVLGFTICGSVATRSNLYNSEQLDIKKEPKKFIRVIAEHTLMTDAELGSNTFIKRDRTGKYIVTP